MARLIAAASAIGTACNMAVAFAKYRRERPRVTLSVDPGWAWVPHGTIGEGEKPTFGDFRTKPSGGWVVKDFERPYVELTIKNDGQSKVRIVDVRAEVLMVRRSIRHPRGEGMSGIVADVEPFNTDMVVKAGDPVKAPFDLESFGGINWEVVVPKAVGPKERLRISVRLSGGSQVCSRWMRAPVAENVAPVSQPYEQLSLDEDVS
ncbi:hypothetical protein ACIPYQ_01680 [Streptomyces sp. NPDC090045]|uniref:hypothetical protein n=1 Tax=Streptomyces sp. NPDC090045 TaxID=3365927 RepID=UPI003807242E